MSQTKPQTYTTHRRFDPMYHLVLFALVLAGLVLAVVQVFRQPGITTVWMLLISISAFIMFLKLRIYPLMVQDRLIRLEERLRMERLLPEDLRLRMGELTIEQCVGLRFASDQELAALVEEVLAENLDREAIKKRIQVWKPDTYRV